MFLLLTTLTATAGTTVSVGSLSVDGLEVRDLSCNLEKGGLLASAMVVGALAAQKSALDACAPEGGAWRASWTWSGGALTDLTIPSASAPDKNACIEGALRAVTSDLVGTCEATLLVGDLAAAEAAAATLQK